MSSSSSALTRGPARVRVLRGGVALAVVSGSGAVSPLEAELGGPVPLAGGASAAAEAERGYDDGYRAGLSEGLAAGRAAATAESASAMARFEALARALADAADDLRRRQAIELSGLEDALARAAVDLAAAVVGRELELSASPGVDALARALALVPAGSTAVARLHPADAARLGAAGDDASGLGAADPAVAAQAGEAPAGVTVIPDPAIEPGGCILEVGDSRIDAQLGPALDRVRSALSGDGQ